MAGIPSLPSPSNSVIFLFSGTTVFISAVPTVISQADFSGVDMAFAMGAGFQPFVLLVAQRTKVRLRRWVTQRGHKLPLNVGGRVGFTLCQTVAAILGRLDIYLLQVMFKVSPLGVRDV